MTGGEPLVRKDAAATIQRLSKFNINLTMTTNGTRLHHFVDVIKESGIRSLNISLDTLKKERFITMIRRDLHDRVICSIELMVSIDIDVKVNVVLIKGTNDDEINDFIRWTKDKPIHVRFIEFMSFDGNGVSRLK